MENVEIYLLFPPDIEKAIRTADIDVAAELERRVRGSRKALRPSPPGHASAGGREKEPATVILATSVLVVAVGAALRDILEPILRRPILVEQMESAAVKGTDGQDVHDKAGNPVREWRRLKKLLEPGKPAPNTPLKIAGQVLGMRIEIERGQQQNKDPK